MRWLYPGEFKHANSRAYTSGMEKKILFTSGLLSTVVVGILTFAHFTPNTELAEAAVQPTPVPFTKLIQGEQSIIGERVNYIVTNEAELTALWKLIGATSTPPTVDFSSQTVLAIFAGKDFQSALWVSKVEDADQRLVSIVIKKPDSTCATTKSTKSPFEIVAVAATSLPFTHQDIVTTTSCSN